ncbi:MAG TPA: NAD(P)-dependent oxidoreductase [Chthonomonadaceae bacterium]|nr:NAD(P)-dependent oxidoreductase [Chthonomonadaceae bacterium]
MRVLVIGGSGHVGSLALPFLKQHHTLRVFDLRPPADATLDYVAGDVGDPNALARAAEGMEALVYMAMGSQGNWGDTGSLITNLDVNIKGVYLALRAAHEAGISHAVYASSMSVYSSLGDRYFHDENYPPDAVHFYGFSKRLGEEVCQNACRQWGMSVNALRLCLPQAEAKWLEQTKPGVPTVATAGGDVLRAFLAALERRFGGFEAFMISGDYEQKLMNMSKAKRLLDWEPLARPRAEA